MGTRSLTVFTDQYFDEEREVAVIYRQFDGYLEAHGLDLAEILAGGEMVNGISGDRDRKMFNGMGCLAAQVVAQLKDGVGNIYLEPAGTRDAGEEYIYEVYGNSGEEPHIKVSSGYKDMEVIFDGSATEAVEAFRDWKYDWEED